MARYDEKVAFLKKAKSIIANHYNQMCDLPMGISSETRYRWREEATEANVMIDAISQDILRLFIMDELQGIEI